DSSGRIHRVRVRPAALAVGKKGGGSPFPEHLEEKDSRPPFMSRRLVVAILGPTATGKSALALALAERYAGEIVNCDSTAVYRGFDIGTDKVAVAARRGIPHHCIDIADPTEEYTAADFARDATAA